MTVGQLYEINTPLRHRGLEVGVKGGGGGGEEMEGRGGGYGREMRARVPSQGNKGQTFSKHWQKIQIVFSLPGKVNYLEPLKTVN